MATVDFILDCMFGGLCFLFHSLNKYFLGSFEISGQTSTFTTSSNYVTIVSLQTQLLPFFLLFD